MYVHLTKSSPVLTNNGDGTYDVMFQLTVENFGNVVLSDLEIFDDVIAQFSVMNPTRRVTTAPTAFHQNQNNSGTNNHR